MTELEQAEVLASKILDRPNADPDDDTAVLARQFLRARERETSLSVRCEQQRERYNLAAGRVSELEAALRPFADGVSTAQSEGLALSLDTPMGLWPATYADFEHARAVLAGQSGGEA